MSATRHLGVQSMMFVLGAAAMLGSWVVVLIFLLQAAYAGFGGKTGSALVFAGLIPAALSTVFFVRTARLPRAPISIGIAPLVVVAMQIAALVFPPA